MKKMLLKGMLAGMFGIVLMATSCRKSDEFASMKEAGAVSNTGQTALRAPVRDLAITLIGSGPKTFSFYGDVCSPAIGTPNLALFDYFTAEISGGGNTLPSTYATLPLGTYYVFPGARGTTPYLKVTFTSGFTDGSNAEFNNTTNTWTTVDAKAGVTIQVITATWVDPC